MSVEELINKLVGDYYADTVDLTKLISGIVNESFNCM